MVACLIKQGQRQTRTFSTMTGDLRQLSDWLTSEGCTPVAIESTGVYWKPVFNLLEAVLVVIIVNALDAEAVPAGRKTDVRDCQWLADMEAATARVSEQIIREVAGSADPFAPEAVKLLQSIPGIGQRVAEVIVFEIGVDMTRFPHRCPSGKLGWNL